MDDKPVWPKSFRPTIELLTDVAATPLPTEVNIALAVGKYMRRMHEDARTQELVAGAIDASGLAPEDFVRRIWQDDDIATLFAMAIDAAMRSRSRDQIAALSRVLASGVRDTARVDESQLIVAAIAPLDPVHILALRRLAETAAEHSGEVPIEEALAPMNLPQGFDQAVINSLANSGFLKTDKFTNWTQSGWEVTSFGWLALDFLKHPPSDPGEI